MPDDGGLAQQFERFRSGQMPPAEAEGFREALRQNPELLDDATREIVAREHLLDTPPPPAAPAAGGPGPTPFSGTGGLDSLGRAMATHGQRPVEPGVGESEPMLITAETGFQPQPPPPFEPGTENAQDRIPLDDSEPAPPVNEPFDFFHPLHTPEPFSGTGGIDAMGREMAEPDEPVASEASPLGRALPGPFLVPGQPRLGGSDAPLGRWGCRVPFLGIVVFGVGVVVIGVGALAFGSRLFTPASHPGTPAAAGRPATVQPPAGLGMNNYTMDLAFKDPIFGDCSAADRASTPDKWGGSWIFAVSPAGPPADVAVNVKPGPDSPFGNWLNGFLVGGRMLHLVGDSNIENQTLDLTFSMLTSESIKASVPVTGTTSVAIHFPDRNCNVAYSASGAMGPPK